MFTSFLQLLLLIFMIYVCIYTLVNRVCECLEKVSIAKSFSKFNEAKKETFKEFEKSFKELNMDDGK